jgi:Mg2+-importing ATPase
MSPVAKLAKTLQIPAGTVRGARATDPADSLATHAMLHPGQVLAALNVTEFGLSAEEVSRRRSNYGLNEIAVRHKRGPAMQFCLVLVKPLPLALLGLAVLNVITSQPWGGAVIAAMVLLSSLLSFIQEHRSDRAAERLRAMVHTYTRVQRRAGASSHLSEVTPSQLVPGDIVVLSAGEVVPADLQILHCRDLFIDQSTLTGESLPVEKHAEPTTTPPASPLDWPNIAFMGTSVLSGTAQAVVIASGGRTAFGAVAYAATSEKEQTGFDRGLQRFIRFMLRVMLLMMLLVFVLNGLVKGDWLQAFQFSLAVAVGLAPELLPVVVTVNLAKGAMAMAERKCIVKRLSAIQDLGAMDVLCTDKTGTLTQNRVILARHVDIDGHDSRSVTELAYLNSHFQTGLENLMDKAVVEYAHANGLTPSLDYRKIDELPYDFQRRRMSVILKSPDGGIRLICKGAVEEVLSGCMHAQRGETQISFQDEHSRALLNRPGILRGSRV